MLQIARSKALTLLLMIPALQTWSSTFSSNWMIADFGNEVITAREAQEAIQGMMGSPVTQETFLQILPRYLRLRLRKNYLEQNLRARRPSLDPNDFEKMKDFYRSFLRIYPEPHRMLVGDEALRFLYEDPTESHPYAMTLAPQKSSERDSERLRYLLVGEVVGTEIQFRHYNDWDMTGGLATALGMHDSDDLARTSGVEFRLVEKRSGGEIELDLVNWLFTERTENPDEERVEEESTVTIRTRKFSDSRGKRYAIFGLSFTNRTQKEFIGSWIQDFVHSLGVGRRWKHAEGDQSSNFLQAIIGAGARYDVLQHDRVSLSIDVEAEAQPSTYFKSQSNLRVRSSASLRVASEVGGLEYPLLHLRTYVEGALFADRRTEDSMGIELFLGYNFRKFYIQGGLFAARFHTNLDRRYEGGPSWLTGIAVTVQKRRRPGRSPSIRPPRPKLH